MTVCDIYDALTAADRPYKKAVPREKALRILEDEGRAGLLDPWLVERLRQREDLGARGALVTAAAVRAPPRRPPPAPRRDPGPPPAPPGRALVPRGRWHHEVAGPPRVRWSVLFRRTDDRGRDPPPRRDPGRALRPPLDAARRPARDPRGGDDPRARRERLAHPRAPSSRRTSRSARASAPRRLRRPRGLARPPRRPALGLLGRDGAALRATRRRRRLARLPRAAEGPRAGAPDRGPRLLLRGLPRAPRPGARAPARARTSPVRVSPAAPSTRRSAFPARPTRGGGRSGSSAAPRRPPPR